MQFTATLFDNLYKRFYGQTWFSAWHKGKVATDSFFRVNLSEVNYNLLLAFHKSCFLAIVLSHTDEK